MRRFPLISRLVEWLDLLVAASIRLFALSMWCHALLDFNSDVDSTSWTSSNRKLCLRNFKTSADGSASNSNNTGIFPIGPTVARHEITTDWPCGITVSCFLDLTADCVVKCFVLMSHTRALTFFLLILSRLEFSISTTDSSAPTGVPLTEFLVISPITLNSTIGISNKSLATRNGTMMLLCSDALFQFYPTPCRVGQFH